MSLWSSTWFYFSLSLLICCLVRKSHEWGRWKENSSGPSPSERIKKSVWKLVVSATKDISLKKHTEDVTNIHSPSVRSF